MGGMILIMLNSNVKSKSTGKNVDFTEACNMMSDELKQKVHDNIHTCNPQKFYDVYWCFHLVIYDEEFI